MSRRSLTQVAVGLMLAALLATLLPDFPGSGLVVGAALLLAPGIALASLSSIEEPVTLLLLAVPVSAVTVGLLATGALYIGVWDPLPIVAVIAALTFLAAALGSRERLARSLLVVLTTLPALVILAASMSSAEI